MQRAATAGPGAAAAVNSWLALHRRRRMGGFTRSQSRYGVPVLVDRLSL